MVVSEGRRSGSRRAINSTALGGQTAPAGLDRWDPHAQLDLQRSCSAPAAPLRTIVIDHHLEVDDEAKPIRTEPADRLPPASLARRRVGLGRRDGDSAIGRG
jgi:hypothetical protein